MAETNHSSGDSNRTRAARPGRRWLLVVLLALAALPPAWTELATWNELNRLERELARTRPEGFFLGSRLREGLALLNAAALRFELSSAEAERQAFDQLARRLSDQLGQSQALLTHPAEQELAAQAHVELRKYLASTAPMLEEGVRGIRRDTAAAIHRQLAELSAPLLRIADELVESQNASTESFVAQTHGSLKAIRRLLQVSGLLFLLLLGTLAFLIYPALVAPLKVQLDQSQAVIQRQEKLASLGTLAAGVAHEVRNPLAAIKFRLFSLRRSLPDSLAQGEDVLVIDSEINRLDRLVKDFLQFARPSEPELGELTAATLFADVRALLLEDLAKRKISLEIQEPPGLRFQGDSAQLRQVLINLVQNAADALTGGGTITLSAHQGAASLNKGRPMIVLDVADTGPGIPPEVEARLFDPFFSTKEGGTGLGLPIAARIVERHGGFLQYSTRRDRGTTFSVVLPRLTSDER